MSGSASVGWRVEQRTVPAGQLHGSWPATEDHPDERRIAVCRPTAPAVVLGSTQSDAVVDARAAATGGLAIVRRRSGGGAVLVTPDDPVWVDAWIPSGDDLWHADVAVAFAWLGATWQRALTAVGLADLAVQGTGSGACTRWSSLVCFGGVGTGEVTSGGRKVVGLAQRRTRPGTWFHGACVVHWDPTPLLAALALAPQDREAAAAELAASVTGVADAAVGRSAPSPVDHGSVVDAFLASLPV